MSTAILFSNRNVFPTRHGLASLKKVQSCGIAITLQERGWSARRMRLHKALSASLFEIRPRQRRGVSIKHSSLSTGSLSKHIQQQHSRDASSSSTASNITPYPSYHPPKDGLLSYLPQSILPYAELIRLDKPTGTYYLFFPCLFSTLLAAPMTAPITSPTAVLETTSLFLLGALIMRGAGCTINDLWDRNLDAHVERTRLRPIARGAINPRSAIIFTGFQLLTGLAVLVQFPQQCLWYGIPSLLLVATYPLAKRVTYYPQFVLGLTFSWGAIMGFPALGVDLLADQRALYAAACLYTSNVAWTVLYDMIYAHMDVKDDAGAGIKSIVVRHGNQTKVILSGLAAAQVGLLGAAGVVSGAGPIYFLFGCGGTVASLAVMIWRVNLKRVSNCWWWFRYGCWFTGGALSLGMFGDYLARWAGIYREGDAVGEGMGIIR